MVKTHHAPFFLRFFHPFNCIEKQKIREEKKREEEEKIETKEKALPASFHPLFPHLYLHPFIVLPSSLHSPSVIPTYSPSSSLPLSHSLSLHPLFPHLYPYPFILLSSSLASSPHPYLNPFNVISLDEMMFETEPPRYVSLLPVTSAVQIEDSPTTFT